MTAPAGPRAKFVWPMMTYGALTIILLLLPLPASIMIYLKSPFDKLLHAVLFMGFTRICLRKSGSSPALVLAFACVVAAGTEVLQSWTSYRGGELWDCLAGVGGALLGTIGGWKRSGRTNAS